MATTNLSGISETAKLLAEEAHRIYSVTFHGKRFEATTRTLLAQKIDEYLRKNNLVGKTCL